jgi:hypothetical protein
MLALVVALSSAAPVLAQAEGAAAIDESVRLYEDADLEGALAAIERAERGPLDKNDLLRLLATRVLIRFGLGLFEPLERDLLAIATIAPDFDLGIRAPPPIQQAFERARSRVTAPLSLRLEIGASSTGAEVGAATVGDRANVVRRIEIAARPAGASTWRRGEGRVELAVEPGDAIEAYARALGPGGAVLATDGSHSSPRRLVATVLEEPGEGGSWLPWLLAGAGVLAIGAAVAITVLVLGGSDTTQPIGPVLER